MRYIRDTSEVGQKGYNSIVKGIVVSTDDPRNLGRIKVRIPCYHGTEEDPDKLPWAQVCITKLPQTKSGGGLFGMLQQLISDANGDINSLSLTPEVGEIVLLAFEGGSISAPIVLGVDAYTTRKSMQSSGSGSGMSASIAEGSPAYMMAQIMMKYESNNDYGAFIEAYTNTSSETAITIGAHQNMGPNAKNLLLFLRQLNQSAFDTIANVSGLLSDITGGDDWGSYNISKSSSKAQSIIKIMTTDWGVKGQISKAAQDVQRYMQEISGLCNVTDTAGLLYMCDVRHQYGLGGLLDNGYHEYKRGCTVTSLEQAYNMASKSYYNRRKGVYDDLKSLRDSGKLKEGNSSSSNKSKTKLMSTRSFSLINSDPPIDLVSFRERYTFPTITTRNITRYFEKPLYNKLQKRTIEYNGIDIYDNMINGEEVLASFNGIIHYETDLNPQNGCGYKISLVNSKNSNIIAEYLHLGRRIVSDGEIVKEGQLIGVVGNTGCASFPMLHFSIKINGGYQNPLLYLKN